METDPVERSEGERGDPRELVEALSAQLAAGRVSLAEVLERLLPERAGTDSGGAGWPEVVVEGLAALLALARSRAPAAAPRAASTADPVAPRSEASRLRVLLIGFGAEEGAAMRRLLEGASSIPFEVRAAESVESVPWLLGQEPCEIALLDLGTRRGGTALLSRAQVLTEGLPIVCVVSSEAEALLLRDASCGVLVRDGFDAETAAAVLRDAFLAHRVGRALDGRDKEPVFATRDPLTGLPNRSSFHAQLDIALSYAERHGEQVVVLFVDIDRFGDINERLGEEVGDGLIITLAERMSQAARKSELVARVGDDEFALMLQGRDLDFAPARTAERLLECLSQAFVVGGSDQSLSASIGISAYPRDAADPDALIRNAASAAYQAKAEGRNGYRFYGQAMTALEARKLAIASRLRGVLERGALRLHYQPRVDGRTGRILGAEALLRWTDRELGAVPPAEFVPIAERMGLMGPIGSWVMQEACRAQRSWAAAGHRDLRLSVNVSAHQIETASLRDAVVESWLGAGQGAGLLEIELTESALVHNERRAARMLREFDEVGVSLALDDFGTGYSSLGYLRQFPVSTLKIDPSFVRAIRPGTPFPDFVEAILALARSLGLAVVAEGVETAAQRDALLERGCTQMQGYLFARPMPCDEFLALLEEAGAGR